MAKRNWRWGAEHAVTREELERTVASYLVNELDSYRLGKVLSPSRREFGMEITVKILPVPRRP
jgi:hypothetical protein